MRHGKPDVAIPRLLASWQVRGFIDHYNAAGIKEGAPPEAIAIARQCPVLLSSDLLRTQQSALALKDEGADLVDPIFREAELPYFHRLPIILPPAIWLLLLRGMWWFGYSRNGESIRQARERAGLAVERLIVLAREHERLLLVGHGFSNHFIAQELLKQGWSGALKPGHKHWKYSCYRHSSTADTAP